MHASGARWPQSMSSAISISKRPDLLVDGSPHREVTGPRKMPGLDVELLPEGEHGFIGFDRRQMLGVGKSMRTSPPTTVVFGMGSTASTAAASQPGAARQSASMNASTGALAAAMPGHATHLLQAAPIVIPGIRLPGYIPTVPMLNLYAGQNTAVVYAAPTVNTTYVVTGTVTATGCSKSAMAIVKYTPPPPVIVPPSVNMYW